MSLSARVGIKLCSGSIIEATSRPNSLPDRLARVSIVELCGGAEAFGQGCSRFKLQVLGLLDKLASLLWLFEGWHVDFLVAIDQVEAVTVASIRLTILDDAWVRMDIAKRLLMIVCARPSERTLSSPIETIFGEAYI